MEGGLNADAQMLAARLALVERVHRVELAIARVEDARAAAIAIVRGKTHQLGNAVQIVQLASQELARRITDGETAELVRDLREGADLAQQVLGELLAAAAPGERVAAGAPVAPAVRHAVEAARAAVASRLDLACDLADDVRTFASEDELAALVFAAVLDAADAHATHVSLTLRARTIAGKPFVQLLCADDRRTDAALPPVIDAIARAASGEASRDARELAIELGTFSPSSTTTP